MVALKNNFGEDKDTKVVRVDVTIFLTIGVASFFTIF
jgi:hypothetical protein